MTITMISLWEAVGQNSRENTEHDSAQQHPDVKLLERYVT